MLDASVIIKWYTEENLSPIAREIRDLYINGQILIIVPTLLEYEVLNGLKYTGQFTLEELNTVGSSLENYGFKLNKMEGKYRQKMTEIAMNHRISIYDAAYIALAIEDKCKLITADEKIQKKLPKTQKSFIINLSEFSP